MPLKPRTILIIEDNALVRKAARLTLTSEGFAVLEASNAAEGLRLAIASPPDLVLQDLLLPDMDGFDLVQRLRAEPSLAGVPIIAFSGFLSRLEYGRATAVGFTDFLPKPIEPSRLIQVIRAYLPPDEATEAVSPPRGRLLVVDDDPVQRRLTRVVLSQAGWDVTTAGDGVEALEVLARGGIDTVLTDVLMPRLDGFGLCTAIRRDARLSKLPVILVSSNYLEDADRRLAQNIGATGFVLRTPDFAGVLEALACATPHDATADREPDIAPVEHHQRVIRQLERQAALNAALAHRSSMHASMLSVVAGISEALTTRHSVQGALPEILASLLEATGVSSGALFVNDGDVGEERASALDGFVLRAHLGFTDEAAEDLVGFLGHPEFFAEAVTTKSPLVVSTNAGDPSATDMLARAGGNMQSALLVPLVADDTCLGTFFLSSHTRDLTEGDWIPFVRALAVQVGQALSLSRAFSKLALSENRYRVIVEGATEGILTLDWNGVCRDLNPAMERYLGRPRHDVLGSHIGRFIAPDDQERSRREFAELLRNGSLRTSARRVSRPDGSIVLLDISAKTIDAEGGLIVGVLRDVTEEHNAEAVRRVLASLTLVASEAPSLRSALGGILARIGEADRWALGIAWLPHREKSVLECASVWSPQRDGSRSQPPGEQVSATGALAHVLSTKRPLWISDPDALEVECTRTKDASGLHLRGCLLVPIVSEDRAIAILELFTERVAPDVEPIMHLATSAATQLAPVLARKGVEDALRASEARFARLAESGIVGIVVADVTGNIHEANDAFLQMVGYSRKELVDGELRWLDLTPTELMGRAESAMAQLLKDGVAPPWEMEAFRKDRARITTLVGAAMLEHPRFIAFIADVTERKRAEEALLRTENHLRQAQKMEAVGRLAGGVAHDFNNVLSVILSYGEILQSDLAPDDPMRADIGEILKAGRRAADLTRQLLMFSRQQVIEPKVLDLNEVLAGMEKMLHRILGEDIEVVSVLERSLGRLKLDPSSVEQVVMNLVVNARDAMPTGGRLTIETANVVLDEAQPGVKPGPYVMLAVTDTGIGMDKATQAMIFEPFFTTKDKDKGTGLGLSTVYGIVQQSGGSVSVSSEPGKGTTFELYFPRVLEALDVAQSDDELTSIRGTETVLLVEDEDQVRVIASSILRRHGYRVLEARHGAEAVSFCERRAGPIDLLITDVVMPQMSGPELAKRLRVLRPEMRVLCMSGYTDDSIVRHGVLQAEIAYLQKPITPRTLIRKVRQVLDAPPPSATGSSRGEA